MVLSRLHLEFDKFHFQFDFNCPSIMHKLKGNNAHKKA